MSEPKCSGLLVLMLIAPGFDRMDYDLIRDALQQRGFAVNYLSLSQLPVVAKDGSECKADFSLSQYTLWYHTISSEPKLPVRFVITPRQELPLKYMANDARIPRFLRQITGQNGQVVVGPKGLFLLKHAKLYAARSIPSSQQKVQQIILRRNEWTISEFVDSLLEATYSDSNSTTCYLKASIPGVALHPGE